VKTKLTNMALVLVFAFSAGIWLKAQERHELPASKTGVIASSTADLRVGGTVLPKGDYQVRCDHKGSDHELVFRKVKRDSRGSESIRDEVARVKCRMEDTGKKTEKTTLYTTSEGSDIRKVTEILVRGESVRHLLD